MKTLYFILIFALLLPITPARAQWEIKGDTIVLHRETYPNGKLSAYSYLLSPTSEGRATAWDPRGNVMFDSSIRRKWGHHSVNFTHHPNKIVSKVEESSAPDAGIQWYRAWYYFDEQGKFIRKDEDSHDRMVTLPELRNPYEPREEVRVQPEKETPNEQEVMECAIIYHNETWFVNETPFDLEVKWSARGMEKSQLLKAGESAFMGDVIQAQFFQEPEKEAQFSAKPLSRQKKARGVRFEFLPLKTEMQGNETKRYYYRIWAVLEI